MNNSFTPDPKLQQMAQAFAADAVAFAEKVTLTRPPSAGRAGHVTAGDFKIKLDYSDASIRDVEDILAELHRGLAAAKPSPEQIERHARIFGCYVGETFRRNHKATWGATQQGPGKMPSMRSDSSGTVFFPWMRAYKRITEGDEENVAAYYQYLLDELSGSSQPSPSKPPPIPGAG
jgi:hypothetical protein